MRRINLPESRAIDANHKARCPLEDLFDALTELWCLSASLGEPVGRPTGSRFPQEMPEVNITSSQIDPSQTPASSQAR